MATPAPPTGGAVSDLRAAVDAYERQILSDTMVRCRFNQKVAAEALGLSYDQIRHALKSTGSTTELLPRQPPLERGQDIVLRGQHRRELSRSA